MCSMLALLSEHGVRDGGVCRRAAYARTRRSAFLRRTCVKSKCVQCVDVLGQKRSVAFDDARESVV
jgi:hypothetical protein